MPSPLTGYRQIRSVITLGAPAAQVDELEIDLRLASNEGIEIVSMFGMLGQLLMADNAAWRSASVTLHARPAPLEDPNDGAADADQVRLDTPIIYNQQLNSLFDNTNNRAAYSIVPDGPHIPAIPILVAQNMTHRVAWRNMAGASVLVITYRYVRFSDAELGILLARRI